MASTIRSGSRSKFSDMAGLKAAMDSALGNKPESVVVEAVVEPEFVLTQQEPPEAVVPAQGTDMVETTPVTPIPHQLSVTQASCVRALERSFGFGRNAFRIEVAVSLAAFASSSTGADRATKKLVTDLYGRAGYDTSPQGRDYKTVNRRVNTYASLYRAIGQEGIEAAVGGLRDAKAIDRLCEVVGESYNLNSIYAVLEYVGKPVEQSNTPEVRAARAAREIAENNAAAVGINARVEQRQADQKRKQEQAAVLEDGIIVSAGKLSLVVPRDCTATEVRAMIAKLTEFADRMDAEMGTPEEQRNREMHA